MGGLRSVEGIHASIFTGDSVSADELGVAIVQADVQILLGNSDIPETWPSPELGSEKVTSSCFFPSFEIYRPVISFSSRRRTPLADLRFAVLQAFVS